MNDTSTIHLTFLCPQNLYDGLLEASKKKGLSRSEYIISILDKSLKETNESKLITKPKKKFVSHPDINPVAWNEFEIHRKEIKKVLTDLARLKAQNILKKYTYDEQQEIVNYSITGRYTGLFPQVLEKNLTNVHTIRNFGIKWIAYEKNNHV